MKENEEENNNNLVQQPVKRKGRDLKIIIVGDSGTGKTSIVNKYILNKFAETYSPTIASQFSYKIIKIEDVIYRLQFWDIAGQDKSPETTKIFCRDTKGIILCCEVNNNTTKENTIKWKESIENNIDLKDVPIILVENKCDLLGKDEKDYNKNIDSLKTFVEKNNIKQCFRTSALNGYGVEDSITYLIREVVGVGSGQSDNNYIRKDSLVLKKDVNQHSIRNNNKKKCC